jgi:hypothetical protein
VPGKQKVAKCVAVGDPTLRNVGAEHADVMVECFPGIKNGTATQSERKDGSW